MDRADDYIEKFLDGSLNESVGNIIEYDPEVINLNTVVWNVMPYLSPEAADIIYSSTEELSKYAIYEDDNLLWKRRVENILNNWKLIGPDDITLGGYDVNWEIVWRTVRRRIKEESEINNYTVDWDRLFYIDDDNQEYIDPPIDMGADLEVNMSKVFRNALGQNKSKTVRRLLEDTRFDPNIKILIKIRGKTSTKFVKKYPWLDVGTSSTIREFMSSPKFDPSLDNSNISVYLSDGGSMYNKYILENIKNKGILIPSNTQLDRKLKIEEEILKISIIIRELLNDSRLTINNNIISAVIIAYRHKSILKVLIDDVRIRNVVLNKEGIKDERANNILNKVKDIIKYYYGFLVILLNIYNILIIQLISQLIFTIKFIKVID